MKRKELKIIIKSDLYRYHGDDSFSEFISCFKIPGFKYTYFMRKCSFHRTNRSFIRFFFFRLFLKRYKYRFGFIVSDSCKIGKGLYIGHFGRIILHPRVELGSNVNLSPGVTIGQTNRGKLKGVPKIGNKVWIGTNALIVGKITIGNNAVIGPGAYVNFDVPENAVVMGNPGKIVSSAGSVGYVNNIVDDK